jgi:hypothetical protein
MALARKLHPILAIPTLRNACFWEDLAMAKAKKIASGAAGRAKASAGGAKKRASGKRELIDTGRDKRFVRRDSQGQFKESDDVGRSLASDQRRKSRSKAKSGHGDKGDR